MHAIMQSWFQENVAQLGRKLACCTHAQTRAAYCIQAQTHAAQGPS